jgi:hypothetical protein
MSRTTTIDAAQIAILDALRVYFGDRVAQVGLYDPIDELTEEPQTTLQTPALMLGMDDGFDPRGLFEAGDGSLIEDPWGRMALRCYFTLRCVLSTATYNLPLELSRLAAAASGLILRDPDSDEEQRRGNTWGLGAACDPPEGIEARPGGFLEGAHGWDSWTVTWEQTIYTDGDLT